MTAKTGKRIPHQVLELDGRRYVVLAEDVLQDLCRRAGIEAGIDAETVNTAPISPTPRPLAGWDVDNETLAGRLVDRRKRVGLSQAALARRAGVRVETLNRIERAKTTPDFSTVRKLVGALNRADAVARRLTEWRRRVGLSQDRLARRAGISAETLRRIEQGRITPDLATVRKLVMVIKDAEADRPTQKTNPEKTE